MNLFMRLSCQIWAGFHSPYESITVTILEVTEKTIGYCDKREVYFMDRESFENRFEYKA